MRYRTVNDIYTVTHTNMLPRAYYIIIVVADWERESERVKES